MKWFLELCRGFLTIFCLIKWPVKMSFQNLIWPVMYQIWKDIVLWPAVIWSPVMWPHLYSDRLCFLLWWVKLQWESEKHRHLKFIQECALVQSEATLVALRLEPIEVLSVIGQRTKEHSWINSNCPQFYDFHCETQRILKVHAKVYNQVVKWSQFICET